MGAKIRFLIGFFGVLLCLPSLVLASSAIEKANEAFASGEFQNALAILDEHETTNAKEALHAKLKIAKIIGNNELIVQITDKLLKLEPNNTEYLAEKALAQYQLGFWDNADKLMTTVVRRGTANTDVTNTIARYYLWKQDYQKATAYFKKVLRQSPHNNDAQLGLAYIQVWQEDNKAAIKILDQILKESPEYTDGLILRAWIYAWEKDYANAKVLFTKAESLLYNHPETLNGLAKVYLWDNQPAQSISYYEHLLTIQPENPDVLLALGRLYRQQGQFEDAIDTLEKAFQIDSERIEIKEELDLARTWPQNIESNIRDLRRNLSLNRGDTNEYLTLGRAFRWNGQLQQAEKTFLEALHNDPENIQVMFGLAQIYEGQERFKEARDLYEKILALKPDFIEADIALANLKSLYRPTLLLQYSYDASRIHDPNLNTTFSVSHSHFLTTEITQRVLPQLTIFSGYRFGMIEEIDKIFDIKSYDIIEQQAYLGGSLTLPHQITLSGRYSFHHFQNFNSSDNFFNLAGSKTKHGGYFIAEMPVAFNFFSLQYSRQYLPAYPNFIDVTIESTDDFVVSDELTITDYFSVLVAGTARHQSIIDDWSWDLQTRPRFVLPFFNPVALEYRFNYLSHPDRFVHEGAVNYSFSLADNWQNFLEYRISHDSISEQFSHTGTFVTELFFTNRISCSINTELNYTEKTIIGTMISSLSWQF